MSRIHFPNTKPAPVLVVGSVAYDDIETPRATSGRVLGGSASFCALAAAYYAPVRLVGVVGGGLQGTIVVMLDEPGFGAVVTAMSGGMIQPSLEDSVSMSVIGELTNMVSGRALIQSSLQGVDVTPPQIITGAGIRTIPTQSPGIRTFTLPFRVAQGGTLYLILSFHG